MRESQDVPRDEPARPSLYGVPHIVLVPLLLAWFVIAGALSAWGDSAVFDETAHLPAGYTYLDRRDFRLNPEHPPLAKAWAALPVWLAGRVDVDYDSPAWRGVGIADGTTMRTRADQWRFGFEFLNGPIGDLPRRDPARALFPARLVMLAWGAALGLIVFAWAREMWGSAGGLLALFLYCLSPTMLAHSRLVTTDMPVAFGFTATLWCLWRFLHQPGWGRGAWVGLALGGALLVKFSSLLLVAILGLQLAVWAAWPGLDPWERRARRRLSLYLLLGAGVLAWATLWAGYGFRYPASPDPTYQLDWEVIDIPWGRLWNVFETMMAWKVLPQAYIYGLSFFVGGAARRLAFLNGDESIVGWWYYFPEAFLFKTPPALFLLLGSVLVAGWKLRRGRSHTAWYLALPVLVYAGVSMASHLNLGHRHLAAVYPLLFVGAGGLPFLLAGSRRLAPVLAVLLGGYALSFAAATPGYLSYFNLLAVAAPAERAPRAPLESGPLGWLSAGPRRGSRFLLDSNLDWGQDLGRLRRVMDRHGIEVVHLAYFGTADPRAYGIRFRRVQLAADFYPDQPASFPASGDYLAVSANLLHGLYTGKSGEFARRVVRRGWVAPDTVRRWDTLRDRLSAEGRRHLPLPDWLIAQGALTVEQRDEIERSLLATRLTRIRDTLEPVAVAGESIYVYRIP